MTRADHHRQLPRTTLVLLLLAAAAPQLVTAVMQTKLVCSWVLQVFSAQSWLPSSFEVNRLKYRCTACSILDLHPVAKHKCNLPRAHVCYVPLLSSTRVVKMVNIQIV